VLPIVTTEPAATFAWEGSPTTTALTDDYMQSELPFSATVRVGDGDAVEPHPFEAR
jgi:hypothetical protein